MDEKDNDELECLLRRKPFFKDGKMTTTVTSIKPKTLAYWDSLASSSTLNPWTPYFSSDSKRIMLIDTESGYWNSLYSRSVKREIECPMCEFEKHSAGNQVLIEEITKDGT